MSRDLPGDLMGWVTQLTTGVPVPEREYRFHPKRKWLFDLAWPDVKLAIECHGNVWSGRHTRGLGFTRDREKMNAATIAGWTVLELTSGHIDKDPLGCAQLLVVVLMQRGIEARMLGDD